MFNPKFHSSDDKFGSRFGNSDEGFGSQFDGYEVLKGEDGISPVVEVTDIIGGHRIIITDKEGKNAFDVMDGEEGPQGNQGPMGPQGPQGPQGIPGEQGPQGEVGPKGDPGKDGKDGKDGNDGVDGLSPFIGSNGNWWIGNTDTGTKARGEQGVAGAPGKDGSDYVLTDTDKIEIAEQTASLIDISNFDNFLTNGSIGLKYALYDDHAEFIGLGECTDTVVEIASMVQGLYVTAIGVSALQNGNNITEVVIPKKVTSIDTRAFSGCSSLTNITIPSNVTMIRGSAFYNCSSLTSIVLPDSVVRIDARTFSGCSGLTSITIPFVGSTSYPPTDTLQSPFGIIFGTSSYIGGVPTKQFYFGSNIPGSWTSETFYIPASLKSVTITGGHIIPGAFSRCVNITSVTIGDRVMSIGDYAFWGCAGLTSVKIPDSVTGIELAAFASCTSLENATIGNGVTNISDDVFNSCSSLTSVVIPDTVTGIGNGAFYGCKNLSDVYYTGTEEQWNTIAISANNTDLTNATIHYNWEA